MFSPSRTLAGKKHNPTRLTWRPALTAHTPNMFKGTHLRSYRIFCVIVKEKSDRNCPERAERTSVRISLMGLLYRNGWKKSSLFLSEITFIPSWDPVLPNRRLLLQNIIQNRTENRLFKKAILCPVSTAMLSIFLYFVSIIIISLLLATNLVIASGSRGACCSSARS